MSGALNQTRTRSLVRRGAEDTVEIKEVQETLACSYVQHIYIYIYIYMLYIYFFIYINLS